MVEERPPRRGEIWWAVADKRRPVLIVQADFMNRSRTDWILVVPLTSNIVRGEVPGNVRLSSRDSGLSKASIANVTQVAPVPRSGLRERVGSVSRERLAQVDEGLRLVLALAN